MEAIATAASSATPTRSDHHRVYDAHRHHAELGGGDRSGETGRGFGTRKSNCARGKGPGSSGAQDRKATQGKAYGDGGSGQAKGSRRETATTQEDECAVEDYPSLKGPCDRPGRRGEPVLVWRLLMPTRFVLYWGYTPLDRGLHGRLLHPGNVWIGESPRTHH